MTLNVPIRLTSMIRLNDASECGPSLPTVFSATPMPAQLTAPRNAPNAETATPTAFLTLSSFDTFVSTKRAFEPRSEASAAPFSLLMSAMMTFAPFSASRREVAPPNPEAPPEIRKVFPLISIADASLLRLEFRLQAVRLNHITGPPEGGTPNYELFVFVFTLLALGVPLRFHIACARSSAFRRFTSITNPDCPKAELQTPDSSVSFSHC